jgi:hypothetical protein
MRLFWAAPGVAQGVESLPFGTLPLLSCPRKSRYISAMQEHPKETESAINLLSNLFPDLSEEELKSLDQALGRYISIALRVFDDFESRGVLTEGEESRSMETQRSNITSQFHEETS